MVDQSRWFGGLNLDPTSSSALTLDDIERVLDSQGPLAVDRDTSSAEVGPGPSAEFHIQCSSEPGLNVNLIQDGDLFLVEHPSGVDEHYGEPQIDQMLRRLAKVLATTYEIEETCWRGRVVRAVHRQQGVDEQSEELVFILGGSPPVVAASPSPPGDPSADSVVPHRLAGTDTEHSCTVEWTSCGDPLAHAVVISTGHSDAPGKTPSAPPHNPRRRPYLGGVENASMDRLHGAAEALVCVVVAVEAAHGGASTQPLAPIPDLVSRWACAISVL